jgi:hypothetical protein
MASRTSFVFAVMVVAACKGSGKGAAAKPADLGARCEELAKTCGDNEKHIAAIIDSCKQAAQSQQACAEKVGALYTCYQSQLCGKTDRVWALDDLGVLAQRKGVCTAELKAVKECK